MKYNSQRRAGRDYSRPAKELIPEVIADEALTIPEIAKRIGRSDQVIRNIINSMRAYVHVESWVFRAGTRAPRYRLGPGEDAPKPPPLTNSEKIARYLSTDNGKQKHAECNKRWLKSERGREYRRNFQKARWAKQKFEKNGISSIDPLLAAIMGVR